MTEKCPSCGAPIPEGSLVTCKSCGGRVLNCPKCGAKITKTELYCRSCGTNLADIYARRQNVIVAFFLSIGLLLVFGGIAMNPEFLVGGVGFIVIAIGVKIDGARSLRRLRERKP